MRNPTLRESASTRSSRRFLLRASVGARRLRSTTQSICLRSLTARALRLFQTVSE
jgi:hypothetical protein